MSSSMLTKVNPYTNSFPREAGIIYRNAICDHHYNERTAEINWGNLEETVYAELEERPIPKDLDLFIIYILQPPKGLSETEEALVREGFPGPDITIPTIQNFLLYDLGMSNDPDRADMLVTYLENLLVKYAEKGIDRRNWYLIVLQVLGSEYPLNRMEEAKTLLEKQLQAKEKC